jgi:hypothetical protein
VQCINERELLEPAELTAQSSQERPFNSRHVRPHYGDHAAGSELRIAYRKAVSCIGS